MDQNPQFSGVGLARVALRTAKDVAKTSACFRTPTVRRARP